MTHSTPVTPDLFGNYPFETWIVIPAKAGIHSSGLSR